MAQWCDKLERQFFGDDRSMANLNRVFMIGRLTRDPEPRTLASGGQLCNIGFCRNNRRKNQQTGQSDDEPVLVDVTAWGKISENVCKYLKKGSQAFIEGHLVFEQWTTNDGQKRTKLKVVAENVQFLDGKAQEQHATSSQRRSPEENDP